MIEKEYYNNVYLNLLKYKCHYSETKYYPIWLYILGLIKEEKIFEGGCGTGQFAQMLIENDKNYQLGIDYSKEAIKIAKNINSENKEKFKIWDLLELDKIKIDYNLFLCLEVLEHIDNDLEVLRKIKENKKIIFSVPNFKDIAHVRIFENIEKIILRYGKLIKINNIKIHKINKLNNSKIFTIQGIKK